MDWNPHAPDVIGLEFQPRSGDPLPAYTVDAPFRAAAMRIVPTENEYIDHLGMFMEFPKKGQISLIEVLDAGNLSPEKTTDRYYIDQHQTSFGIFHPNIDGSNCADFTPPDGVVEYSATQFLWQENPADNLGITPNTDNAPRPGTLNFPTIVNVRFPVTGTDRELPNPYVGRRILDVRVCVVAQFSPCANNTLPHDDSLVPTPDLLTVSSRGFNLLWGLVGPSYALTDGPSFDQKVPVQWGKGQIVASEQPQTYVFSAGEMNPHKGGHYADGFAGDYNAFGDVFPVHPWTGYEMDLFNRDNTDSPVPSDRDFLPHIAGQFPIIVKGYAAAIKQIYLEIDSCEENRLAVQVFYPTSEEVVFGGRYRELVYPTYEGSDMEPGWAMVQPKQPQIKNNFVTGYPDSSYTGFNKVIGQDIMVLARAPRFGTVDYRYSERSTGVQPGIRTDGIPTSSYFNVPYLESFKDTPTGDLMQYPEIGLEYDGRVSFLGVGVRNRVIGVHMGKNTRNADGSPIGYGPASCVIDDQSLDSQPYVKINTVPVTTAEAVSQKVTTTTAETYDGVLITTKYSATTAPGVSPSNLIVRLRRVSDNVLMATATITQTFADSWPADSIDGWRLVQVQFQTPVLLAASTEYYITVAKSSSANSWFVACLSDLVLAGDLAHIFAPGSSGYKYYDNEFNFYGWYGPSPPANGTFPADATYGGEDECATYGGVEHVNDDLAVLLFAIPDPPTLFKATPELLVSGPNGLCVGEITCGLDGVPYVQLSWELPNTLSNFDYYEVQRKDVFTDWEQIAKVISPNFTSLEDVESPLNTETCYRIRTWNLVGIASEWVTATCLTLDAAGCGYTFTNNEYPDASIGYSDAYDSEGRKYEFPEVNERKLQAIHGRDFFVAFRPSEQRGVHFERKLIINGLITPDFPGPRNFDALRNLTRAPLQYICVRDNDGNRFYASVTVPEGTVHGEGAVHQATINVDEITSTPQILILGFS